MGGSGGVGGKELPDYSRYDEYMRSKKELEVSVKKELKVSEEKSSLIVSQGPYRSTELKLEDKLNDRESRDFANTIEKKIFGLAQYDSLGLTQIGDMLSALGYQKESDNLYINKSGKFVYLSDLIDGVGDTWGNMRLISGNYSGNIEKILSDVRIIKEMAKYYNKEKIKENSLSYAASSVGIPLCSSLGLGLLVNYFVNNPDPFAVLAGICGLIIGVGCQQGIGAKRYRSNMSNLASSLSNHASKYSYGKEVYDKIISEYYELTKPKQLKSPELKQLPLLSGTNAGGPK